MRYVDLRQEYEDEDTHELRKIQAFLEDDGTEETNMRKTVLKDLLNEKLPYCEAPRPPGTGDLRIGTALEFEEDIFSLAFCCMIKDELINKYFDIENYKFKEVEEEEGE